MAYPSFTKPHKWKDDIIAFGEEMIHCIGAEDTQKFIHLLNAEKDLCCLNAVKCPPYLYFPVSISCDLDNKQIYLLEHDGYALRDVYSYKEGDKKWDKIYAGLWQCNQIGAGPQNTVYIFVKNNKCYFTASSNDCIAGQENEMPQSSLNIYEIDDNSKPTKIKRINNKQNYDHYDANAIVIANSDNTKILQIQHGAIKQIKINGDIDVLYWPKTIEQMPDYYNGAVCIRDDKVIAFGGMPQQLNKPFIDIIDLKTSSLKTSKLTSATLQDVKPVLIDNPRREELLVFGVINQYQKKQSLTTNIPTYLTNLILSFFCMDMVVLLLEQNLGLCSFVYFKIPVDAILCDKMAEETVLSTIAAEETALKNIL